jgi:transmembrane sensor
MNQVDREILERFFREESTEADAARVREIFADENLKDSLHALLAHQWNDLLDHTDVQEKNLDPVLHKIHFRINMDRSLREKTSLHKIWKFYYRIAAVIALPLLLAAGVYLFRNVSQKDYSQIAWAEIHSTMGSRVSFNLPDGTRGWLNSGSTLKYALNFSENRRVELDGEAYFDVAHDKSHPFYVKTPDIRVKVLGTIFNLKDYHDDRTAEATLITGMLEIQTVSKSNNKKQTLVLKPHQKATLQKNDNLVSINTKQDRFETIKPVEAVHISHNVDTVPIVSWKDHKLVFVNENFESLLTKMKRWYDVDIIMMDKPLNNLSYTGIFEKETVEQALRALRVATPNFNYTINKNIIKVSFKNKPDA